MADLLIRGAMVVDPEGGVAPRSILVRDERIAAVLLPEVPSLPGVRILDAGGFHLFPGLVEPHAHLGYGGADMPGHFESETAAATLGGVTTVINIYRQYGRAASPYDELGGLLRACQAKTRVDFAVHLAVLTEDHVRNIPRYATEHGIRSFKFYMAYRGEDGRQIGMTNEIDDGLLVEALSTIAAVPGGIACFHCENTEIVNRVARRLRAEARQGLLAWSESRPAYAEAESIHRAATLGAVTGCPVYVLHMGSRDGLAEIERHRARGERVYLETAPHYLTLTHDAPVGSLGKVNPPLRAAADVEAMWQALACGTVDTVGTDHCAVPRARKVSDIWEAAPGFPGMATMLPLLITEGHVRRGVPLARIAEVTALNPARLFGLAPRKGTLRPGADADFVLADLGTTRPVEAERDRTVSGFSLWEGWPLAGWPVTTMVRGTVVMDKGDVVGAPGGGRYFPR